MNLKEQEMRKEARAAIVKALRDGYNGFYCNLHNRVFNTGYYIVGAERAKEALEEYGIYEAIRKVQTYEKDNFGEIYTDRNDPEKLIHALYYIIGEEVLWEMLDYTKTGNRCWNKLATDETNAAILEELGE